jgi:hypothetical protein
MYQSIVAEPETSRQDRRQKKGQGRSDLVPFYSFRVCVGYCPKLPKAFSVALGVALGKRLTVSDAIRVSVVLVAAGIVSPTLLCVLLSSTETVPISLFLLVGYRVVHGVVPWIVVRKEERSAYDYYSTRRPHNSHLCVSRRQPSRQPRTEQEDDCD